MNIYSPNVFADSLHSFDSVYHDFVVKDNILVPWLNVGLYNSEINNLYGHDIAYVDRAFFRIKGIGVAIRNSKLVFNTKFLKSGEYKIFQLDGINIEDDKLDSFEFFCKEVHIEIPSDYKIQGHSWLEDKSFIEGEGRRFLLSSNLSNRY